jgi:hypothetical protein
LRIFFPWAEVAPALRRSSGRRSDVAVVRGSWLIARHHLSGPQLTTDNEQQTTHTNKRNSDMPDSTYLPSRDADLLGFAQNFNDKIKLAPTAYGLTAAMSTAFELLNNSFKDAMAALQRMR